MFDDLQANRPSSVYLLSRDRHSSTSEIMHQDELNQTGQIYATGQKLNIIKANTCLLCATKGILRYMVNQYVIEQSFRGHTCLKAHVCLFITDLLSTSCKRLLIVVLGNICWGGEWKII